MDLKKNCTAPELLKLLPVQEIAEIAKTTGIDYNAKKITGMRMMSMMIISFLSTTRLSQRIIGEEACEHKFPELFGIPFKDGPLSHSSISYRLDTMPVEFFEKSYTIVMKKLYEVLPPQYLEDRYVICDSSMVADTAAILKEGLETGLRDSNRKHRKQLKYSMSIKGFDVKVAKIFSRQNALSEDVALARTVRTTIRVSEKGDIVLFDRGTCSLSNLKTILELSNARGVTFIGRLKMDRRYQPVQGGMDSTGSSNGDVEIVEDTQCYLYDGKKRAFDTDHKFRIVKAKLLRIRPDSRITKGRKRKKEDFILLITNDFKSTALEVCEGYRKRWSIEVFFKFLKQNLSFSHLLSSSRNGLMIVLYLMLITAALVKIFEILNGLGPKIAIIRMKIQLENWIYDHPKVDLEGQGKEDSHVPITEDG